MDWLPWEPSPLGRCWNPDNGRMGLQSPSSERVAGRTMMDRRTCRKPGTGPAGHYWALMQNFLSSVNT